MYNISTGKSEVDSKFPTDTASFLGLSPANIRFQSTGESEFVSLLLDGNKTVYPLVKDSTPTADSVKGCLVDSLSRFHLIILSDLYIQGDHGGLTLDFADFHSEVPPVFPFAMASLPIFNCPSRIGRTYQIKDNDT